MTNAKDWQEKYKRTLEELEHLKSDWEVERDVLRRGIAKMSIAAQGFDDELDNLADDLRQYVRGQRKTETQALASSIQKLELSIEKIDDRRSEKKTHLINAVKQLATNIKPQLADETSTKKLINLEAHIERAVKQKSEPDLIAWLRLLANLPFGPAEQNVPTTRKGDQKEKPSVSEFKEHVRGGLAAAIEKQAKEAPDKKPFLEKLKGIFDRDKYVSEHGESQDISEHLAVLGHTTNASLEDVRHALKAFLSDLDPPRDTAQMVRELQDALRAEVALDQVPQLVARIRDITSSVIRGMGDEFREFLSNIDTSLGVIGEALGSTQHVNLDLGPGRLSVDEEIRKNMENLSQNVEQASELEPLKVAVKSNIETIVSKLDEFKRLQAMQDQSLAVQLKDLVDKVARMENESEKIETQLIQQRERSLLDQLTQVPNRAAYEHRLRDEYERWKRYRNPLSLMVCDIDHFKAINDNFGHLAGDKVLKVIGTTLADSFRTTDFVARYGGEEFVILLPETDLESAYRKADEVRKTIEGLAFHFKDEDVKVTASLGVAMFKNQDEPLQVFERADQALYEAKRSGRNRVQSEAN